MLRLTDLNASFLKIFIFNGLFDEIFVSKYGRKKNKKNEIQIPFHSIFLFFQNDHLIEQTFFFNIEGYG
jgi:hypothetical protein